MTTSLNSDTFEYKFLFVTFDGFLSPDGIVTFNKIVTLDGVAAFDKIAVFDKFVDTTRSDISDGNLIYTKCY